MKKLITLLLSVLMIATCSMTVFANGEGSPVSGTSDPTTDSTNLTYKVTESYSWYAPADITFDQNSNTNEKTGTLGVTENVITGGKKLSITITGGQEFKIKSIENIEREYTVKGATAGELSVGGTVLEVNAGTPTGSEELTFALQGVTTQQAGTYTGELNFSAAIIAQ